MSDGAPMLWCRLCEEERPSHLRFCPVDNEELVDLPTAPPPPEETDDTEDDPGRPRTVCWNCGTAATDRRNRTCTACHESLEPPALVIDFPHGPVVVRSRGTTATLGRAGEFEHVFEPYPNVSRRHATVAVDGTGVAWLTPDPVAPNGTFVNDEEIFRRTALEPGDRIRFATDRGAHVGPVSTSIRFPQRG